MDIMNVTVAVGKVYEQQGGVSASTGKEWKKLLFEANSVVPKQWEKPALFQLFGVQRVDENVNLIKEGAVITISFSLHCREWNGNKYPEPGDVYSIKAAEVGAPAPTPTPAPAQNNAVEESSDLPF